jgi:hypothetical protein
MIEGAGIALTENILVEMRRGSQSAAISSASAAI